MYLGNNENSFSTVNIDIRGEQTSNTVAKFKLGEEYDGLNIISRISISDFIQDELLLDAFSVDTTVTDGYASLVIPYSLLNALQASTYSIQATLSYNGNTVKEQAIIVKKGN